MVPRAVDRNLQWFRSSGMLPAADGSKGVREGFRSLDYGLNGSLRTDCVTQAALTFALYSQLSGDSSWKVKAQNALNFIFHEGFQDKDKGRPTFGFWKFFDSLEDYPVAIYADDNSWAAYSLLRIYQLTQDPEYLSRALTTLDDFLDTQTPSGLRIARMEGPELLKYGREWYAENGKPDTDPHYVSNADRTILLAYEMTKSRKYLDSARRSIDAMAQVFPNFRRSELTRATQFAVFLSSPALLYYGTHGEKYRALLLQVLKGLREHQDGTGAIAEWGNSTPANFGGEGPVIISDGEPITDQLYTTSFALLNLHDACYVLQAPEACDSFVRLADYLTRIQIRSPDPCLNGAWNRAFDFESWETYGNNSDPFWGPDSIESGWTNTSISIALMDYLAQRSAFLPAWP